jgi:dienelactone hydrolase
MHTPIRSATTLLFAALVLHPAVATAQSRTRSAAILLLKGQDTVIVERIRRSDSTVTAIIAGTGLPRMNVSMVLAPTHLVRTMTLAAYGPGAPADAQPLQTATVAFDGDTARLEIRAGGGTRNLALGTKADALPIINNDFVTMEQAVRRARAAGVRTLTVPLFALSTGVTIEAELDLFHADSARFSVAGNVSVVSLDAPGNVTGGHLPGQGIDIVVVEGPAAAAISIGRPDYSAPAGAPYAAEEVTVRTPAGHTLSGTLTLPTGTTGKLPAVVTITGSGQQDRDEYISLVPGFRIVRQVADTLGRRGIAVLRMDDRGVGGSGGDVNGTSADFADDIRAGIAYLRSRPEIDPARIALVGHSEGGMIAPMIAATDSQLAAIVLMAGPSQKGRTIIDYQIGNAFSADTTLTATQRDSAVAAARATFDSTAARAPWMRFFLGYDPVPTLRKVTQPVLVLHGATDRQVTVEQAHQIAGILQARPRAGGPPRAITIVFPDRNHLFLRDPDGSPANYVKLPSGRIDDEVMGTLADWLALALRSN